MSQTKKTVVFLISFFITLFATSLSFQFIAPLVIGLEQSAIFNIVSPLISTIALLIFIILQALIKYMFNRRALVSNANLVSANISKFGIKERLLPYAFFLLIYFIPLLKGMIFDYTFMIRILLFIGSVVIVEILLRISNNRTKIFFQRNGFLITGFDARAEIPFGMNTIINNDSGFYSYKDIKEYLVFPDRIELKLINDIGKIVFMANGELKRQFTGLMVQHKIPVKKVSE